MPLSTQLVLRINEMLNALERVQRAIGRMTSDELVADEDKIWVVECGFEIISGASRSIPKEVKELYGDIPWIDIASLGSILRHRYWMPDPDTLWETALRDLPELRTALDEILRHDGEPT
jgi:uncharacterized protein with HEPN domain